MRLLRHAGLPTDVHLHHLRHHYASVLIDGDESVKVVQERLGMSAPKRPGDLHPPLADEQ